MKNKNLPSFPLGLLRGSLALFVALFFSNFSFAKNPAWHIKTPDIAVNNSKNKEDLKLKIIPSVMTNYCTTKSNAPWELWISNVQFNTMNCVSEKFKEYTSLGYSDYTNLNTTINKSENYPLCIIPGLSWSGMLTNAYCRVWIDYNKNNAFETNEMVLEKMNQNPFTQRILIPNSAAIGTTLMRVAIKFGAYPTPCETFEKGEVEDYTVNIVPNANPCANDETPPVFTNCPQNIQKETFNDGCTYFTWTPPTVTDDCNISSVNFISKKGSTVVSQTPSQVTIQFCEPEGKDTIIYTAQDTSGNTATCSFTLTNINACISQIKVIGQFPNDTTFSTPDKCISYKWQVPTKYFPCARIGNYQSWALVSTQPAINVLRIRGNIGDSISIDSACFPIGTTVLTYRFYTPTNGFEEKKFTIIVESQTESDADMALSIMATPSVYRQYQNHIFNILAKNNSETALSNVKIEFKFPPKTVSGGTGTPTIGTWQEWCTGGVQCFTWTIPMLAAHEGATLEIPLFILDATAPIVATTRLLSSTPMDRNPANNIASLVLNPQQAQIPPSIVLNHRQFAPILNQKVVPTISTGEIFLELESIVDKTVNFNIVNSIGQSVFSEKLFLEKGMNIVPFNLIHLSKGMYFIQTDIPTGHNVPMKFIKM